MSKYWHTCEHCETDNLDTSINNARIKYIIKEKKYYISLSNVEVTTPSSVTHNQAVYTKSVTSNHSKQIIVPQHIK